MFNINWSIKITVFEGQSKLLIETIIFIVTAPYEIIFHHIAARTLTYFNSFIEKLLFDFFYNC